MVIFIYTYCSFTFILLCSILETEKKKTFTYTLTSKNFHPFVGSGNEVCFLSEHQMCCLPSQETILTFLHSTCTVAATMSVPSDDEG